MADEAKPKIGTQLFSTIIATLGGMVLGTTIGWYSPADKLLQDDLPESKDSDLFGFISSIMPLGAASSCLLMGLVLKFRIARKLLILAGALGMCATWVGFLFSNSFYFYCGLRFLGGFFSATFCVSVPTYVGEIAHKSVRGMLGTFFQFQVVIGILLCFCVGETKSLWGINIPCLAVSIALAVLILFVPETPVYYLLRKNKPSAEKSLQFLRGKGYDLGPEMADLEQYTQPKEGSFCDEFRKTATWKGFLILMILHAIQQLTGINVVMFYAHRIFEMAGATLEPGIASIILGLVQVFATAISIVMVDKFGRKIMWYVSLIIMLISLVVIGAFFFIQTSDEETATKIGILPLIFVNVYLVGFSLGAGPLPWVILGEILPSSVKFLSSVCAFENWILAFLVTYTFPKLVEIVGPGTVFIIYAGFCVLGTLFVIFVVVETKNKTLAEIQESLDKKKQ